MPSPNGSHEVRQHREGSNAEASKGGSGGNVSVQLVDHRGLPVASHHHLLLPQLLGHVLGRAARHVDPGLAEEGAGAEHEGDVEDRVDRVRQDTGKCVRGREVVAEAADGVSSAATIMPHAQKIHEEVAGELN